MKSSRRSFVRAAFGLPVVSFFAPKLSPGEEAKEREQRSTESVDSEDREAVAVTEVRSPISGSIFQTSDMYFEFKGGRRAAKRKKRGRKKRGRKKE